MRNSKIVALVATAALLVIGAAFTSMAATYNWYQEDGVWHCKDKNGDDIVQDWAKSGNDMYYLDENGEMATEAFLDVDDEFYYVAEDGKMVKNQWVKVENTDDDGDEYYWYYFQNTGKAKKGKADNKPVTINGKKYMFDGDGKMLYGWIDGDANAEDDYAWETATYYAGDADDGAIRTGWAKVDVLDEREAFEDQSYWFWFGTNGKKFSADVDTELYEKSINGKKYAFDNYGVMKAEWGYVTTASNAGAAKIASTSIDGYAWFQDVETGAKLKKGWFRVVPKDLVDPTDADEETVHWYYAKGNGALYTEADGIKTIGGKKYAFNNKGEMLSGLVQVNQYGGFDVIDTADGVEALTTVGTSNPATLYFFGDEETDGSMKYGTVKTEIDGEDYTFTFKTTGSEKGTALNGLKNNYYYVNGVKVTADSDMRYEMFKVPTGGRESDGKVKTLGAKRADQKAAVGTGEDLCLISTSGSIIKSGTKKNADGYKIKVSNYKVESVTAS